MAALLVATASALGCGRGAPVPLPAATTASVRRAPPSTSAPALRIRLRPELGPPARVQVDLGITFDGKAPVDFEGLHAEPHDVVAVDDRGAVPLETRDAKVHLSRPPVGALHLRYDVAADASPSVDPLATVVQEDRFRAAGEHLLLLPTTPLSAAGPLAPVDVTIEVDGSSLSLARAASTMGIGLSRTRAVRPEGLLHASFVGGSLYSAVFDAEAHDETAWLGDAAFDPRPASAEIAQIRTAIGEFFRSELPPFTTLFVSQARPLGSFSTHVRSGGVLVLLGPSQTWDAALRLSITEQIVHRWIGGEIRLAAANETEARANAWFTDGVARFVAMRFLARLGLLSPEEVRTIVAGEMAAVATSPHRGASAAALASDPRPTARAELTARGALAALRIHRLLRDKASTEGPRSFDDLLLALAAQAKLTGGPLPVAIWRTLLTEQLGAAELATFTASVEEGRPLALPPHALGPCFRDGTTEYVAYDLGFDEAQTLATSPRMLRDLRPDGPASRAGARADDELVGLEDGKHVILTVRRGGKEEAIRYAPEGARARGPSSTRRLDVPASRCGDVP